MCLHFNYWKGNSADALHLFCVVILPRRKLIFQSWCIILKKYLFLLKTYTHTHKRLAAQNLHIDFVLVLKKDQSVFVPVSHSVTGYASIQCICKRLKFHKEQDLKKHTFRYSFLKVHLSATCTFSAIRSESTFAERSIHWENVQHYLPATHGKTIMVSE